MFTKEPPAEVDITVPLVERLINEQFPHFQGETIAFLDSGWDNENYRLGDNLIVRLPRREVVVALLNAEIDWLPKIKDHLPLSIPAPIHVGVPTDDYPFPWSIIPWHDGDNGCRQLVHDDESIRLADFLKALHSQDATDAPYNDHRCLPLSHKADNVEARIERLRNTSDLINDRIEELWNAAKAEPVPERKSLIHGDLHPRNVIVHDGKINALIDWGDMTSGDVATDVASFWMLINNADWRNKGLVHYGADDSLIARSMGWAVFYGTLFLELGTAANSEYENAGKQILKNLQ